MSKKENNKSKCPIWRTPLASKKRIFENWLYPDFELDSPRAGGKYTVKCSFLDCEGDIFDEEEKIVLSAWIARENLKGHTPDLTSMIGENRREAEDYFLNRLPSIPNPRERAYLLLEGLVKKSTSIGKQFSFDHFTNLISDFSKTNHKEPAFCYALSYSNKKEEMEYLLNYLKEAEFISKIKGFGNFEVTVKGFEQVESASNIDSKTAFIAMWIPGKDKNCKNIIADDVNKLCESIETAVKQAGYKPLRIDKEDHIKKIDDEILVNIKKARFVICDLTSEEDKPRGSVYFEAGYALGKNIPIIWTCNESLKTKLAFDIRQYNCLFWEKDKKGKFVTTQVGKEEDFIKKLQKRIENAIGEGPLKQK